jgi:hypothetical protein
MGILKVLVEHNQIFANFQGVSMEHGKASMEHLGTLIKHVGTSTKHLGTST